MTNVFLILSSALIFALLHNANGWIFSFAQISPHIGWIYLPAFVRLVNVLILGNLRGSLATVLGSLLLIPFFGEFNGMSMLNAAASAAGPLIAAFIFRLQAGREVSLVSIKDLTILTLIYCAANALTYHLIWMLFDPAQLVKPLQVLWMVVGDFNGA